MKRLRTVLAFAFLTGAVACGGDDEEEHEFETYFECWEHHHDDEGLSEIGTTAECDAFFEVTHDDNADCLADHATDVTAGVPQTAFAAHCDSEFPPA